MEAGLRFGQLGVCSLTARGAEGVALSPGVHSRYGPTKAWEKWKCRPQQKIGIKMYQRWQKMKDGAFYALIALQELDQLFLWPLIFAGFEIKFSSDSFREIHNDRWCSCAIYEYCGQINKPDHFLTKSVEDGQVETAGVWVSKLLWGSKRIPHLLLLMARTSLHPSCVLLKTLGTPGEVHWFLCFVK